MTKGKQTEPPPIPWPRQSARVTLPTLQVGAQQDSPNTCLAPESSAVTETEDGSWNGPRKHLCRGSKS